MTQEEFLLTYEKYIVGAFVEGFKLVGQFSVLELSNEKENVKIQLHIDCEIFSNDNELNDIGKRLINYDKDVYEIVYFVAVNLKTIISIKFLKNNNMNILFENNIELTFKLNEEWTEPLNISILKEGKYLKGCRLTNNGTFKQ